MQKNKKSVPPFMVDISVGEKFELIRRCAAIIKSEWFVLGKWTERLEDLMAERTSQKYAVTTNTGSTALEVSFRALTLKNSKKKKVLVPTNTNYSNAASVLAAGCTPVLYDSDAFPDMESFVSQLDQDVLAAVVVHIGGYITPDILKIKSLCQKNGVALIEDCAHAHGSSIYGKEAGSFGDIAAFSFFVTKTVPGGEGGCIVHSNNELREAIRLMPNQGKASSETTHRYLGGSWRITEFAAAMAEMRMAKIDKSNQLRRKIMDHFSAKENDNLKPLHTGHESSMPGGYKDIWIVRQGFRYKIENIAEDLGVTLARPVYDKPLHRQPLLFPNIDPSLFPKAEGFTGENGHICLPLWHSMKSWHIDRVDIFLDEASKLKSA